MASNVAGADSGLEPMPFVTPADILAGHAEFIGDKTAIVAGAVRLTWRELDAKVSRVANGLVAVIPRPGRHPDPKVLRAWINDRVTRPQRVSRVRLVDQFPRNALGKILKKELRATYAP
ncbi:MAG: hypothetical protein FJ206_07170 [Gemmatimonadetes bacterium]|nr:hypothetical protein [Gemmatimonadota bacterium]